MKKDKSNKKTHRWEIFFEFLIFGIIMGVVEDLIAIKLATDAEFSFRIIWIVTLVAIPFAVIGELIIDRKEIKTYQKIKKKLKKNP